MEPRDRSIDNQPLLLGLDIGGTKTALILGDLEANVLRRIEIPTPAGEPFEPAIAMISAAAEALLVECKNEGSGIPKAISVSVGGPLDIDRGILYAPPHLAAWGEAPLKASWRKGWTCRSMSSMTATPARWRSFVLAQVAGREIWFS